MVAESDTTEATYHTHKFVIAFLPSVKHLLILWLLTLSTMILEPKKIKYAAVFTFSPSISHEVMGPGTITLVFWMFFKTAFHSSLSPSSRDSLVPLHFLPLEWYLLHIWGCWYFFWQSWFQLVIHPAQHFMRCILHINKGTIYSLDLLLSQFWASQLFHIRFC